MIVRNKKDGFTLPELLIASVVLVLAFVGIILTYIRCMELSEMSRNSSLAVAAVKTKMAEINNSDFNLLFVNYNNAPFTPATLNNARGVTYIDNTTSDLFIIRVAVCWQQKNGAIVGEDLDLDGVLDAGEDSNGDGFISSPVEIITTRFGG